MAPGYPSSMYIETVPNRGSPPAILLRESYRDGGSARKRTQLNPSHCRPSTSRGRAGCSRAGSCCRRRTALRRRALAAVRPQHDRDRRRPGPPLHHPDPPDPDPAGGLRSPRIPHRLYPVAATPKAIDASGIKDLRFAKETSSALGAMPLVSPESPLISGSVALALRHHSAWEAHIKMFT